MFCNGCTRGLCIVHMLRLTFPEFCARYLRGNGFLKLVAPTHGTRVCEYEFVGGKQGNEKRDI